MREAAFVAGESQREPDSQNLVRSITLMSARSPVGLDPLVGDADGDALATQSLSQIRAVVSFVGVDLARPVVPTVVGVMSRLEASEQTPQALAVVDVAT
ncbi:hypothetical protein AQ490_13900 [Wenjunlia vitaminophila]|uniref:Uncharacterized protein n=1 Tax=Wenjunlia vitaminophila TaxID=76728 RepID=A0A0T6LVN6_WENVI|nr:hypothetical protein AQ490_13900 [Wenjunlia vitaminophila]